jgi:hypothetical protein
MMLVLLLLMMMMMMEVVHKTKEVVWKMNYKKKFHKKKRKLKANHDQNFVYRFETAEEVSTVE